MRTIGCVLACCVLSFGDAGAAKPPAPYQWPGPPEPEALARAVATPTESGLVLLERRARIEIRSFGAEPMGVRREEFVRLVVANEAGVRNAMFDVTGDEQAEIEVLEGRTVAPDGAVTAVDDKRDVKRIDVTRRRARDPIVSLASVTFPAPVVGAILELHFVTTIKGAVFWHLESLAYESMPTISTELDVVVSSGPLGKIQWASMTFGDSRGAAKLEFKGTGAVNVRVDAFDPGAREPLSVPPWHRMPMLLVFLDLGGLRTEGIPAGLGYQSSSHTDLRGIIRNAHFPTAKHREFWAKYLKEREDEASKFIKSTGAAGSLIGTVEAPPDMPLDQRLAMLYGLTQKSLTYNPDATKVETLSALMQKGMADRSHASLLLAYLCERAGISYRLAHVVDRRSVRFTPLYRNEYLFGFRIAVLVELPDGQPVFMMPGYLEIPFGSLPEDYQESLALLSAGEKDVKVQVTPASRKGVDRATMRCELELDAAGEASGTLRIEQLGVAADGFARWYRWRQFRIANPTRESRKVSEVERTRELDEALEDELTVPGTKLRTMERRVETALKGIGEPVVLSARVVARGLAEPSGDRWLVAAHPLLAGYENPFTAERRQQPVWYTSPGKVVLESALLLPGGAAVVELPQPVSVEGPGGLVAVARAEKVEKDGRVGIRSVIEMQVPLAVGSDQYPAWRTYQAALAKLGHERCIVTMPGGKVLE